MPIYIFSHIRGRYCMALLEKHLFIKPSNLPGAGKGLFTKVFIPKGTRIIEYKGEILTWKEVGEMADERNGYVFYVNSRHVIDAWNYKKALARYANDARGINRVKGLRNNAEYIVDRKRCYIQSDRDIQAGAEIFVDYGAEYWEVIRYNLRVEQKRKKEAAESTLHHLAAKRQRAK